MPLSSPVAVDTRALFRPVSTSLAALLREMPAEQWSAPTVAGHWVVRDVVAHLLDTTLRRLSFHRDAMPPPPPPHAITSDRDFVAFINGINAQWVASSKRLSPRVLTDLYSRASGELADWFESVPFDAPALFPVSWAGEQSSAGWFDIGREFTELWHHQEQIRMAVGADSLADPRHLRAVIDIAVRGLPHAFRDVPADPGHTVAIDVSGASGGHWTLQRDPERWTLWCGIAPSATARVHMDDQAAWKLLFNALPGSDAGRAVRIEGNTDLGRALFQARSIVV
jgi:uncharacterized protein (TIGR03083 family)